MFKWPNQGTSPSKGKLVCVCVSMCVFGQGGWGGCTLTDRVQVPLQLSTYPYPPPPLLPLHPLRDPSCCTHQQLIQALTKQHHAYPHTHAPTHTHTFYNRTAQSTLDINLYLKMFNRKFRFLFCACLRRWGGFCFKKCLFVVLCHTNFTWPVWLLLGFTGHV